MKIKIVFLDMFDNIHEKIIDINKNELKNIKSENGFLEMEVLE